VIKSPATESSAPPVTGWAADNQNGENLPDYVDSDEEMDTTGATGGATGGDSANSDLLLDQWSNKMLQEKTTEKAAAGSEAGSGAGTGTGASIGTGTGREIPNIYYRIRADKRALISIRPLDGASRWREMGDSDPRRSGAATAGG